MVVLEAAACGVACVGTAVGVVAELAPSMATAVPPGDPRALAAALCSAIDDPSRTAQLGQAARARVGSDFGLEVCTARFRRLYAELSNR
jgi:glycosyltransferase involved in cell wall biosynthesis